MNKLSESIEVLKKELSKDTSEEVIIIVGKLI